MEIREDIYYEYLDSIQKLSKTAIQIYKKLYLPNKENSDKKDNIIKISLI